MRGTASLKETRGADIQGSTKKKDRLQQTATTPLLNKLKPPLCTYSSPGGTGREGRAGRVAEKGVAVGGGGGGVYCTPRRDCGDFINFYTTAARGTSRSEQRRNGADLDPDTNSQIKR